MSRPRKCRKVCCLPKTYLFGALDVPNEQNMFQVMTVEEYETIRLMDLEELTQEECAQRMNVARTTVQRIYTDARYKLAKCLVEGDKLKIEGGDYQLCEHAGSLCGCKGCGRKNIKPMEET